MNKLTFTTWTGTANLIKPLSALVSLAIVLSGCGDGASIPRCPDPDSDTHFDNTMARLTSAERGLIGFAVPVHVVKVSLFHGSFPPTQEAGRGQEKWNRLSGRD